MFKPTKLLKVVSIILIVFGVLGVISLGIGYMGIQSLDQVEGIDPTLVETAKAAYSPLNIALSVGTSLLTIICGILGVAGKAFKVAMIMMIIYIIIDIVTTITAGVAVTGIGMITLVIGLLLPVLYLWGLYQSKE